MDMDKNYTKGSLFSGLGFMLIAFTELLYRNLHHSDLKYLMWPVGLAGLVLLIIGLVLMSAKLQIWFDKKNRNLHFDEQDKLLEYKTAGTGYLAGVIIIFLSWLVYKGDGSVPILYLQISLLVSVGVKSIHYWWLTKDAYEQE